MGSAFLPKPIPFGPTDSFTAFFTMESGPGDTIPIVGDGMTFLMENTPAGPADIGEGGSGLSFFTQTVTPALAVTFNSRKTLVTGIDVTRVEMRGRRRDDEDLMLAGTGSVNPSPIKNTWPIKGRSNRKSVRIPLGIVGTVEP